MKLSTNRSTLKPWQSRRDCVLHSRVARWAGPARTELPWVDVPKRPATPTGLRPLTTRLKSRVCWVLACAMGWAFTAGSVRAAGTNEDVYSFKLDSTASLIRVGAAPMAVTADALEGAEKVLAAIEKKDIKLAEEAIKFYDGIIGKENLGGDYTAMQWLMQDLIATLRGDKKNYTKDAAAYRDFLTGNNYAML